MTQHRTIYCACANAAIIPDDTKRRVLAALSAAAGEALVVADLCARAADRDPLLKEWANGDDLTVIACHPRAVRWLFHAAGASLAGRAVTFLDMRAQPAEEIIRRLSATDAGASLHRPAADPAVDWPPWFPVIDYDRCRNCKQCKNFCLFGVYGDDADGRVVVSNPRSCKNNCPACARICPEAAIMFPKVNESPIDGGDIGNEELVRAKIKVNVQQILGSDVYAALAERQHRVRRRLLKPEDVARAERERQAHYGDSSLHSE